MLWLLACCFKGYPNSAGSVPITLLPDLRILFLLMGCLVQLFLICLKANIILDNKNREKLLIKKLLTWTHPHTHIHKLVCVLLSKYTWDPIECKNQKWWNSQNSLEFHLVLRRENTTWTVDRSENSRGNNPLRRQRMKAHGAFLFSYCDISMWPSHPSLKKQISHPMEEEKFSKWNTIMLMAFP